MTHDSMKKRLRVALIGYGFAGRTFHLPLLLSEPGMNLCVVGSSRPEAVLAALPQVEVCTAEQAAVHPEVDIVVVATPNEQHFSLAAAALQAGKHVVVDKPFTVTLEEARGLVRIAKKADRLLAVFHNRRWYSEVMATREILASGRLGEVSHYECHMDRFRPAVRRRWREDRGPGAGLWYDLGPHLIDQALWFFGVPDTVEASFATMREGGETEDWAHVQLRYLRGGRDRLRVILHASLLVSGGGPRSIVHGSKASWAKYGGDVQEAQLMAGMMPWEAGFGVDADPGVLFDGETGERTDIPVPVGDQRGYYAGVWEAIVEGKPTAITGEHGVAVMAVLEATMRAGREGRVAPVLLRDKERLAWSS